jgi:hypothetical protein
MYIIFLLQKLVLRLEVIFFSRGQMVLFGNFFPHLCPVEARRLRSNEDRNLNLAGNIED